MKKALLNIEVPSAGASDVIDVNNPISPELINLIPEGGSPISLGGNYTLAYSAPSELGDSLIVFWKGGDIDLNGNSVTIFGVSLTQENLDANGGISVLTIDDSGTIQAVYSPSFGSIETINGNYIITNTLPLDRLTGMTAAQIVLADGSNVPTATTVSGDATINSAGVVTIAAKAVTNAKLADMNAGYFKVGNGSNRPADVQMSGDATMDNTGAVTIADGVITPQKLSFTTGVPIVAQINIESAAFQSGNTTPIIIIPAIGGATIIPIKAIFSYVDNGTPYTTNVNIGLLHRTATSYIATIANALDKTISYTSQFAFNTVLSGITDTQYVQGQDLLLQVDGGNAAAGDGTATVTVYYLIL